MGNREVILAICVTALIVVGVNAILYLALRRGKASGQIELMRRAVKTARQPWKSEDDDLEELSRQVEELKKKESS